MIDKIINTIKGYGLQNNEGFLAAEEKAEMETEIIYLEKLREYMKDDYSYIDEIQTLKGRINMLQDALIEAVTPLHQQDKQIPRKDFIEIYNKCVSRMFEENENNIGDGPYEKRIYGNDMTVHWNGMYCNCGSGAIIANEIIPGIEGVEEDEEEDL